MEPGHNPMSTYTPRRPRRPVFIDPVEGESSWLDDCFVLVAVMMTVAILGFGAMLAALHYWG